MRRWGWGKEGSGTPNPRAAPAAKTDLQKIHFFGKLGEFQIPKTLTRFVKFTSRCDLIKIFKHIFFNRYFAVFFLLSRIFSLYIYNIRQKKCKVQQDKLYPIKL